jgi:hypothetical protein
VKTAPVRIFEATATAQSLRAFGIFAGGFWGRRASAFA